MFYTEAELEGSRKMSEKRPVHDLKYADDLCLVAAQVTLVCCLCGEQFQRWVAKS